MSFLAWIFLGLLAGFVGSKVVKKRGGEFCSTSRSAFSGLSSAGWHSMLPEVMEQAD